MGGTPSLDAMDVGRPFEVVPTFVRLEPAALAGRLAGLAALRLRTVPLVIAAAWVGFVQLMAAAALATSAMGGHVFPDRNATTDKRSPPGPPRMEENKRRKPSERRPGPKKTRTEGRRPWSGVGGRRPSGRRPFSNRPVQRAFRTAVAMAEALKIIAISRYKDPSKLSCCAE
jgi:hypothetical protein